MFEVLLASHQPHLGRSQAAAASTVSALTHAGLITLLVLVLRTGAAAVQEHAMDTTLVFLRPPPEAPPPPKPEPAVAPAAAVVAVAPPKGFQTIAAPVDIPKAIPPVNLDEKPFDPRDFTGRGVEGGIAAGVVGGTGKVDAQATAEAVYEAIALDEVVQLVRQPPLRYPPLLERMGIEGNVALEFIVNGDGRVDSASVRVVESSDARFDDAARAVARGSVFRPARLGGEAVRQLVRQRYHFVRGT